MKSILTAILVLALAACASLTRPTNLDQQAAYALAAVTATRHACADQLDRGRMSDSNGLRCLTLTDEAAALLGAVSQAADPIAAGTSLDRAYAILRQLETMLQEGNK